MASLDQVTRAIRDSKSHIGRTSVREMTIASRRSGGADGPQAGGPRPGGVGGVAGGGGGVYVAPSGTGRGAGYPIMHAESPAVLQQPSQPQVVMMMVMPPGHGSYVPVPVPPGYSAPDGVHPLPVASHPPPPHLAYHPAATWWYPPHGSGTGPAVSAYPPSSAPPPRKTGAACTAFSTEKAAKAWSLVP
jgi:hypothetical protein